HPPNLQNHSRLRTPPPPISHAHTPNQHHAASINSLNRGNFTPRSNPSPAPTDHSLSGEQPASTQEPAHAQDNWLLNSNIPLETRNIAKQTFLETLQDNLIEMDILTSSRHDGAYNDGHFLFKPGGTSPLFCTTSPGYPLTSSTVYSPPPRPLPRSTFSRPAFNLKKSYKYCNWKCAALSAIVISVTLVILLAYFIAMHLFGLNWHLQPMEGQMYEITEDTASSWPVPTDVSLYPSGGTGLELPDRKGKGTSEGKPSSFFPDDSFIDSGEIDVGRRATQKIPPGIFWRSQVFIDHPVHLKFNVSLGKAALVGIYGRKGLPPSHTQFDFVELLDGRRLLTQEARSLEGPQRQHRAFVPLSSHETGFIQYLDSGIWHLAFYNDGKESEVVSFLTTAVGFPHGVVITLGVCPASSSDIGIPIDFKGHAYGTSTQCCYSLQTPTQHDRVMNQWIIVPVIAMGMETACLGLAIASLAFWALTVAEWTAWILLAQDEACACEENVTVRLAGEEQIVRPQEPLVWTNALVTGPSSQTLDSAAAIPTGRDTIAQS
ncbi:PREDICTED: teneurin-4-like, partial [Phaethon lepturus]|uniref:teneurin-4-like n=1 Tax=Phaethon lepturus TaxID=97097 RepID=UPI000530A4E7